MKEYKVEMVPLNKIVPDENQPRKLFAVDKMASLIKSIKEHGIQTPVTLEKFQDKYLIVDGERRFRAATELKLKEVPAVVQEPSTGTERLVKQFHIQEQHESWSPLEKAIAINELSKTLKLPLREVCDLLGTKKGTTEAFIAFANLLAKQEFTRAELSLDWAKSIRNFKTWIRQFKFRELGQNITKEEERDIEKAFINKIKSGVISNRTEMALLRDSISKNPKSLQKFIDDKEMTIHAVFIESDAKALQAKRRIELAMVNMSFSINYISEKGQFKLFTEAEKANLESYKNKLVQFINKLH